VPTFAAISIFGASPFTSMTLIFQRSGLSKHPGVGLGDLLPTDALMMEWIASVLLKSM
jgi:hypothetical protein